MAAYFLNFIEQMGCDDNCGPLACYQQDQFADVGDALWVKAVCWFVENQHIRVSKQGRSNRKPLLHAKGKCFEPGIFSIKKTAKFEHAVNIPITNAFYVCNNFQVDDRAQIRKKIRAFNYAPDAFAALL